MSNKNNEKAEPRRDNDSAIQKTEDRGVGSSVWLGDQKRFVDKRGNPMLSVYRNGQWETRLDRETLEMRSPTFKLRCALSPLGLWFEKTLLKIGYSARYKWCVRARSHPLSEAERERLRLEDNRRYQQFRIQFS